MARKCLSLLKEALDAIALAVEGEVIVKAILPPMQALLNAAPNSAALLMVGDIDQLPPSVPAKYWLTSSHRAPHRSFGSRKCFGKPR
jgi:hypothetical protein